MALLAAVALVIISGVAFAGLLVLYYAKLKEEALLDESSHAIYPLWISFAATAVIYAGSASGALLAGLAGSYESACLVIHSSFPQTPCPLPGPRQGSQVDIATYLASLLTHHALGFWAELCAALYAIRFGILKKAKAGITYRRASKTIGMQLKAANSGVLAAAFLLGNPIVGHLKYHKLGCDPVGPICTWANRLGFWDIPGFVVGKIASWVDPWLVLDYTLRTSIGNQFKLAGLFPLVGGGYTAFLWLRSGRSMKDLMKSVSLGSTRSALPQHSKQRTLSVLSLQGLDAGTRDALILAGASLSTAALSFYAVFNFLD